MSILRYFFASLICLLATTIAVGQAPAIVIERNYDKDKDLSTERLGPIPLAKDDTLYHSLDFSLLHQYPGEKRTLAKEINFELVSVVKARRLNTDLYIVFLVDEKPIHFSSNRSAIPNPVPGRLWVGEKMTFAIPFEQFVKIAEAKKLGIKMGAKTFEFDVRGRAALLAFLDILRSI